MNKNDRQGKINLPAPQAAKTQIAGRRELLFEILKKSGQILIATNVIYSITAITSKNGNTAGAK